MEFAKKILVIHIFISVCLCITTAAGTFAGVDVTAVGVLAGISLGADGAWGGFYYWKSKNENRSKYAQKFVRLFAKEYGIDAAIRIAEVVLRD